MIFYGITDTGMRRSINQDSFCCASMWGGDAVLLCVCDGMGGHKAGEIASQKAITAFCDRIRTTPCLSDSAPEQRKEIKELLVRAATEANSLVYRLSNYSDDYRGMGTTLVAAVLYKGFLYGINVGDSRLYVSKKKDMSLVSHDHSFVQYLLDENKITPEEAKDYPRKNVITRAIGVSDRISVDLHFVPVGSNEGGYVLLCSDGLSNYVDCGIMSDILFGQVSAATPEAELKKKTDQLVAYANSSGGADNITVVVAKL